VTPALNDADHRAIARHVVELLGGAARRPGLLTTEEVGDELGFDAEWVRLNKVPLGGIRMGEGPKGDLRFPRAGIDAYVKAHRVGKPETTKPPASTRKAKGREPAGAPPSLDGTGTSVLSW
jgi:hypothetical protein